MAQSLVKTFATLGLDGHVITIEADANRSLPTIEIIGLPDAAIKESKERIRATFRNLTLELPPKKIVLNLAPSDIKKVGTQFDLPMAVAMLFLLCGYIHHQELLERTIFFGELGLDGSVRKVNGLLPAVIGATKKWFSIFFVPQENVHELVYVSWITLYPLSSFREVVNFFVRWISRKPYVHGKWLENVVRSDEEFAVDFGAIKWQETAKRALTIAAAGGHNVLMVWAPGSWKTLLANALQSIMPPLSFEEMVEVSEIYSLVGKLTEQQPLITRRPFRAVHHTASKIAIVWWWAQLLPGEISLAHKWMLFFDELPEFPREVLEVLRQPIEDKHITISRASWSVQYPAHCMFVAAMNPCKCGYYKDPEKPCMCGVAEIARYQSRVSWPLLDRIDMMLEIPREKVDALFEKSVSSDSASLRNDVLRARKIQQKRYAWTSIGSNTWLSAKDIHRYVVLDQRAENFLKQAASRLHFSWRVIHRLLKLSRTIADIEWSEIVEMSHVAEAMQYRSKTMFVEKK